MSVTAPKLLSGIKRHSGMAVFAVFMLAALLTLTTCASAPEGHKILAATEPAAGPAKISDARGPLTAEESRELLKDIGATDALKRHLKIEQTIARTPLVEGNATRILRDGKDTFPAVFAAIANARHHINLEYYIFEDIEHNGKYLSQLLSEKLRQGVRVNMIYDSFGSGKTPKEFFTNLEKAGAKVLEFNPVNPLFALKKGYEPLDRDHRKILVVDGRHAILGGINLATDYQSGKGRSGPAKGAENDYWRDTDIEIQGPAVEQVQKLFVTQWKKQKDKAIDESGFYPKLPPQGTELVRIIGSTPDKAVPAFYVTLLSAIRSAQKNVWITAAYFFPTDEQIDDLITASTRGVDVRLILPDKSDAGIAITLQHSHYKKLMRAGVRIFETHGVVQHSKTVTVDGVWSVVGSSNIDQRSVVYNDESDVVIVGEKTAQQLETLFEQDAATAEEITPATWKERPVTSKFKDFFFPKWLALVESHL